jgi:hypothetical protein
MGTSSFAKVNRNVNQSDSIGDIAEERIMIRRTHEEEHGKRKPESHT